MKSLRLIKSTISSLIKNITLRNDLIVIFMI